MSAHVDVVTRPIINQIEQLVKDVPGWSPADELFALFTLVYATADLSGDVIEIGSWCGRSSTVLGLAAALSGNTKVYCIDLFPERTDWHRNPDGSYSISVEIGDKTFTACTEQTVWAEPFDRDIAPLYQRRGGVFEVFRDTIARHQVDHVVKSHKGTLATFAAIGPPELTELYRAAQG